MVDIAKFASREFGQVSGCGVSGWVERPRARIRGLLFSVYCIGGLGVWREVANDCAVIDVDGVGCIQRNDVLVFVRREFVPGCGDELVRFERRRAAAVSGFDQQSLVLRQIWLYLFGNSRIVVTAGVDLADDKTTFAIAVVVWTLRIAG